MQKNFHSTLLKPTFSILHSYFYKTLTSICLLYTFIQIKYLFFYPFLLFPLLIFFTASLSLLDPTTIIHTTRLVNYSRSNQPKIRKPFKINPRLETHLGRNPLNPKAKSSPTQLETQLIKQREISELTGGDLIRLCVAVV